MTVKENFAMIGVQTTCGNMLYAELSDGKPYLPDVNATIVDRLLQNGAVIFGKTNLPTDAADFQSYNEIYGTSRNPWNLEHTPGGSSGGSAGSIAAGFTPLEVGADIGGSIRTPCHFSGVCGHKPSQGVIDKFGMCPPYPMSLHMEDLAVAGPICRNCDDLALLLDVLAGPDPHRAKGGWKLELPAPTVTTCEELRVAVWADDEYCEVDTEYVAKIHAAAAALQAAGATVSSTARPASFKESFDIYTATLGPAMAGKAVDAKTNHRRRKLKNKWEKFWDSGFDVMLCPVAPCAALKIDESGGLAGMASRKITVNGKERDYMQCIRWAGLPIIADLPVTVVPIGVLPSSGLPVGVQIVAREWHDRTAIEVGRILERVHSECGTRIPPGYAESRL